MVGYMTVIPPLRLCDAKRDVENAMAGARARRWSEIVANLDTASVL
jgi:hypothetical protein